MGDAEDVGSDREALLTAAEERGLALAMEAGVLAEAALDAGSTGSATAAELRVLIADGEAARARFTAANLGLARMVSRQLVARSGVPEADVYQEACLGLLLAMRRFDCRRGYRFATYALFWIRACAGTAAADARGEVNLSANAVSQLGTVRGIEAELTQSLGRTATAREVAVAVGRSERWVADLLAHRVAGSLGDVDPVTITLSGTEAGADSGADTGGTASELLDRLSATSRQVLELRFGFTTGSPLGYAAIGRRLQLPVGRIRRIEQSALEELRDSCPYDLAEGW